MSVNSLSRGRAILRLRYLVIAGCLALLGLSMLLAPPPSITRAQAATPETLAWRVVPPVTTVDLYDVHMLSATDGWAVGGSVPNNTTVVLRYNGTKWSVVETDMQGV